jgi:PAS domain S-box-containing protein
VTTSDSPLPAAAPGATASPFPPTGELARTMAGMDWAATAVGPPETWPEALRGIVRVLLTSRFSMWMAWGPELSMFYNDAYHRDTLQAKHPWALGRPAREVWAEIWPDIGPRIRSVLDTGIATWDEDLLLFLERSGYPEESYHTFSYSPLADETGRTQGMLCVVTENTGRVLGERRMGTLRDLAAAVAETRSEQQVLDAVAEELGRNGRDLPFTLTYLFDDDGTARLGGASGGVTRTAGALEVLPADGAGSPWPVVDLRSGRPAVVDLDDLAAGLPAGAWQRPPDRAALLPFGGPQPGDTAGFLVVGLNPFRPYDEDYRGFLELVAGQIGSGLANAGSYEAERRRAEALAELDRAKTDFFSNVSHEFRTPLTLIMGPVDELRAAPPVQSDTRLREEIETVHRNALRLAKLVNTLLDYSRLQAGRITARFEPVPLDAFTAELASVFRSAFERAGLTFTVDCAPLGAPVHVDRDMWEKIVLNLLSNALKHTFEGGVTVWLREDDGSAVLTVADTGTGIPEDELPRLFERFHRVDGARSRSGEGSGIGLALVSELVALHGGTVTAESTLGEGTRFVVTVPMGTAHLPADHLVAAAGEIAVSPAAQPFVAEALRWLPGGGPTAEPAVPEPAAVAGRVLVADDNADMREYVRRLLSPRYEVMLASDGRAALEAALADPPDLVVSDVMMPELDGMQLLAALRGDPRTARVPVVMLSARAGQEAAVEGLSAGADDYLVKPFSAEELLARVGAHLRLGQVRREAEERFTAMAGLAPALIWVADAVGSRTFLNKGWQQFTGRELNGELGSGWETGLHPDDRDRYVEAVSQAIKGRSGWEVEFRLRRGDGAYHWFLERAVPIGSPQNVVGFVGTCTDINAQFRESERQALLASLGAVLDRATDVDQQLADLARLIVDARLAEMAVVRQVDDDGRLHAAAVAGVDADVEEALARLDPESDMGRAALAGRSTVHPQVPPDWPRAGQGVDPVQAAVHRRLGIRSALTVPLAVRGRVLAVLALGRREDAPPYNDDDRALAEEIADRAALAVENALLLVEERASAGRLALLQQATAQLSAATTPLQVAAVTAAQVRRLIGEAPELGVFEIDRHQRSLTALALSGQPEGTEAEWASVPLSAPAPVTAAVNQRRPLWIEDLRDGDSPEVRAVADMAAAMTAIGIVATVSIPLIAAGRTVGVMALGYRHPRRLSENEREMLLALAEQCAQALDRARLYRSEQRIAETLQRSLLPQALPAVDRLALAARYVPGAEGTRAGGDWYDLVELDEHRVAIAVGDVVGQGPAAAAVMGQLRSALSTALLQGSSPAGALELLDRFAARLPGSTASTAACLVVDRRRGEVTWARAGHLPPLLLGPGGAELLDGAGSGTVLGVEGRRPYTEGTLPIAPGSCLVLFTDGLVERRGEDLDAGLQRLVTAADRLASLDPERLASALLRDLLADTDQPDDVALVLARLQPPPLAQTCPATPQELAGIRRAVRTWALASALDEDTTDDLQLAINEAVANAVEHAYLGRPGGVVDYSLTHTDDGAVEVVVRDHGRWRPPPADSGSRGRGLALIRKLAAGVEVEHPPDGGTSVRFRFPVVAPVA